MTAGIQKLIRKLEVLHDTFRQAVYVDGDVGAALACLTEDAVITHVPSPGGGAGADAVRRHLAEDVLPHLPSGLAFRRISRTADQRRLVEESVVTFEHDRELPWLLPGIAPTGRQAEVLAITIVEARHRTQLGDTTTLIAGVRTLWDLAGLLTRLTPLRHMDTCGCLTTLSNSHMCPCGGGQGRVATSTRYRLLNT